MIMMAGRQKAQMLVLLTVIMCAQAVAFLTVGSMSLGFNMGNIAPLDHCSECAVLNAARAFKLASCVDGTFPSRKSS